MKTLIGLLVHLVVLAVIVNESFSKEYKQKRRQLLVNGVDTPLGRYPWHTRVGCCSGALIAPDVVLSAGHVLPPQLIGMTLSVGAYQTLPPQQQHLSYLQNCTEQNFLVSKAFLHPNYTTNHNDFSIFLLNGTSDIPPVHLNRQANIPSLDNPNLVLLGTGTTSLQSSERPLYLQQTTTQYVSNQQCSEAKDPTRPGISYSGSFLDDTNLCTYSENDGCIFDSGGPILLPTTTNGTADDVLVGLISFGIGCADKVFPAVNARVSAVTDWIDQIVCEYSRDPPSDFPCHVQSKSTNGLDIANDTQPSIPSQPLLLAKVKDDGNVNTKNDSSRALVLSVLVAGVIIVIFWLVHGRQQRHQQCSSSTESHLSPNPETWYLLNGTERLGTTIENKVQR